MPFKYENWEARRNERKARYEKRAEARKKNLALTRQKTHALAAKLSALMKDSGYNNIKISEYSGICPVSVSRVLRRKNPYSVTFTAVVGICRALGYEIKFERLPAERDEFIKDRWIKATELIEKNPE